MIRLLEAYEEYYSGNIGRNPIKQSSLFVFLLFLRKYIFSCEGFTIVDQDINNSSLKVMVAEMLLKMKDNWNFPTTYGHRRSLSVFFACYKVPS